MPPKHEERSGGDSDTDAVVVEHDDISNYNPEQILPQSPETLRVIHTWLQPTAYDLPGGEFKKHLVSHAPGTGAWLTASPTYQQWLTGSDHGPLWIRGIPGSGKSVMAAKLIDELARKSPGCPVLFFFFRQIIDANHEPSALLRDWLDQLLEYSPPLQEKLAQYVDRGRKLETLSVDDMWRDLRLGFAGLPGKAFCIGDALDEMDRGHDAFLQALAALGQWRPEKVKVLITSRPVPTVEVPLRNISCLRLRLEEKLVDVDISTYVRFALENSEIPRSEWKAVEDAVPGRANGLFLYAKLAMDAFLAPGASVSDVLARLPMDLNALYTRLLDEHASRSGVDPPVQRLILQAVTHASRPLRLLELAEMIRVCGPGDGSAGELKAAKDIIRSACGPLLEILPDETVSVVHHSFTEYLKGTTRANDPAGYPVLEKGSTHARLAIACLRYLQSGCLDEADTPRGNTVDPWGRFTSWNREVSGPEIALRLKKPLFEYAVSNWHRHIVSSESAGYDQAAVNVELQEVLGSRCIDTWLAYRWGANYTGVTQLHVAARVGLVSYVNELLRSTKADTLDEHGKTPLWWAAYEGQAGSIRELIAAGANPDKDDNIEGHKPLHEAANKNHHGVVKLLLESGVDPLTPKTKQGSSRTCNPMHTTVGQTALRHACKAGHLESVEAFVPFLKDVDTIHRGLAWAASERHSRVVARLLECPGVDANASVKGKPLLYRACTSYDLDTILALLKSGANPNAGCMSYSQPFPVHVSNGESATPCFSCMHRICGLGPDSNRGRRFVDNATEQAIFSALVDAEVNIHAPDPDGKTPLHGAASSFPVLTRLLLDAGADANVTDNDGNTPLHLARMDETIELLFDLGNPDINRKNGEGNTPLHLMLSSAGSHNRAALIRFLKRGPDCNARNANGDTPLHAVLADRYSASVPLVKALLQRGADPNGRNRSGLTPLLGMRAGVKNYAEVVDVLLKAGADINAVDADGATALLRMMRGSEIHADTKPRGSVQCLLDRGAETSVRDYKGRTLLHVAIESCRCDSRHSPGSSTPDTRIDLVLSLGLDPKAVDYSGNGLLHEFALRRQNHGSSDSAGATEVWEKLLGLGLEVDLRNYAGRTPLHVLCAGHQQMGESMGRKMPIDLAIRRMADIDVEDKEGKTALHLAAGTSQFYTKKLLDAGADPVAAAIDGTTPLHIAARDGRSNTIGLLLDAMRKRQPSHTGSSAPGSSDSPRKSGVGGSSGTPLPGINARVDFRWNHGAPHTPLYYACQSGRPESVKLLLEAGADVSEGNIFMACAAFEPPRPSRASVYGDLEASETTRIGEILNMLVEHGTDVSLLDVSRHNEDVEFEMPGLLEQALRNAGDYTSACFKYARDKYLSRENEDQTASISFAELQLSYIEDALRQALREFESARPDGNMRALFHRFMVRREYDLVPQLVFFRSFLISSEIFILVRHGFALLLDKIATREAAKALKHGDWHAHGDPSRPGLWFARRDLKDPSDPNRNPVPFVLEAVRAELSNMEVLRLLVEKFGVDVNEAYHQRCYTRHASVGPVDSPLHHVARGNTWWHVREALPYLLASGADVGARTHTGRTPLHNALAGDGPFAKEAAEVLIEGGADVNAVDVEGRSCLAYAQRDVPMLEQLIASGAQVTPDTLFAAVSAQNVASLRALLASGIDPNGYCQVEPDVEEDERDAMEAFLCDRQVIIRETPLLSAAKAKSLSLRFGSPLPGKVGVDMEIVRVLLEHGANPFAKVHKRLRKWEDNSETATPVTNVPEGYEELTVLHHLFDEVYLVDPFLDVPELDVNHRDAWGRTLLHMACGGYKGLDYDIGSFTGKGRGVSVFQHLRSLGADLEVRDNAGENVLHHIANIPPSADHTNNMASLKSILADAPHLINQENKYAKTPLHYAALRAAFTRKVEIVRVLLEADADPRAVDGKGDTVLHKLARKLDAALLRNLFEDFVNRGVDPNARNKRGESPLFMFAARPVNSWGSPYAFLEDTRDKYSEDEAIPLLRRLGIDFHAKDEKGRGVLHVAAEGKVERFRELMDAGVDGMAEDGAGQTAVDVAAACGNTAVLELFEKQD